MSCFLTILDAEEEGLYRAADPRAIAGTSPLWQADMEAYGPWRPVEDHPLLEKGRGRIWSSGEATAGRRVILCGECGSSMDVAWRLMDRGLISPWDSVLAVHQTAGRGRRNRTWVSPPGNIHAAWQWPLATERNYPDPGWINRVSLLAGYVAAKALRDFSGLDVLLKWPNDLLVGDRKIGGILTEVRSEKILVGIGINVDASPADGDLRRDFAVPATHLAGEGVCTTPLGLWTAISGKGKTLCERLISAVSPSEFISLSQSLLAWRGRAVWIESGGSEFTGVISGIDPDGGLRLKRDGGDMTIYSGSMVPHPTG